MSRRVTAAVALLLQLLGVPLAAQERDREKKDLRGEAIELLRLGVAEADRGNVDSARKNLTDAAKKLSALHNALEAWSAYFALSHVENAMGRPKEAIAQIEKALAVTDGMPRALQEHTQPITRDLYGSLLTQTGQLERAEEELNRASAGSKGQYDFTIAAHFGDLRFRQRRYDEARQHYQRAVREFAAGSPVLLLDRQTVLAGVYDRLFQVEIIAGHRERAGHWYAKTMEIARAKGGPGAVVDEVVPVSYTGLQDALKVAAAVKNVRRQAAIEASLGNLQATNRKYGAAAAHFERSLQLYASFTESPPSETGAWGDLCLVYIQTGNYAAAANVLGQARKRVGGKSELGDDMLSFLAVAIKFHQRDATAEEFRAGVERYIRHVPAEESRAAMDVRRMLDYAAKALEKTDFPRPEDSFDDTSVATTMRLAKGAHHFQKRNFAEARAIWEKDLDNSPGDTDRANLLLMIGLSYYMEGDAEQASRWLTEGTTTGEAGIDDLRSEDMVTKYLGNQRLYYDALVESLAFSGKIEQSFEAAERARSRAFLRLLGNRRLKPPAGDGSAVVRRAEELRGQIDNWDRKPQPGTSLDDLQQQYEALLPRVQVVAHEYASLTSVPALSVDAVRKELPEDTTLLSYYVTPRGIHAWLLDQETLAHIPLPVSAATMSRITCWAFDLAKPRGGRPADGNGCGAVSENVEAEAYAALVEPLRSKIRKNRLMIVPHGDLHYVPFAALYDGKRSRYLVQDYPITYVPSASTIPFLRKKESAVRGAALVLGDPVTASQPPLPGAGREARRVAGKLHTTAKLGEAAQERLLYGPQGKVDLLHIAAHGTYDAANPLFSAIHLAKDKDENGELTVDEIQSELDLSGVNLVVLSACRSGIGKGSGGDEIIGLTRSILYAGSPGVIATLWNISDADTPLLIEKFYDHLLAGETAADALRAAQTELLRDPKLKHPHFWAAFFLTGDPQGNWKRSAS
ncbi:MAG TPA: CHAT domain-containing protein [Thermoanaerobaculia bacterium]|nr:CHAT domain-containing protein [Thermoanaerobaculia bacterium]